MFETVVEVVPLIKNFVKILKIESEKTWEYHDFLLNSPEKLLNSYFKMLKVIDIEI